MVAVVLFQPKGLIGLWDALAAKRKTPSSAVRGTKVHQ
jgi:hypothetical protein